LFIAGGEARPARAGGVPKEYQDSVRKGLEWLAKSQQKDGHWGGEGDQYPVGITAMAGLALLMEGSTIREGKYAENIRRAVDWLTEKERLRPNGLIGNVSDPKEANRYMYGHGFATLFLASVYGDEEDRDRREKLKNILSRAVKFTGDAQSSRGGWDYTSAKECNDTDEGSVTITQLQALRACRNAGIPVPKAIIDKAKKYLEKSTTPDGGVRYSLTRSQNYIRPALTAAAITCGFSAGEYDSPLVKKWLGYCRVKIGVDSAEPFFEYTHYYYAQAVYVLGDDGYAKLFPKSDVSERITWSKYRKALFDRLKKIQDRDGSWNVGYVGRVYPTALFLTIMQLDNGTLPIYQR
jgi:hypothetical protein